MTLSEEYDKRADEFYKQTGFMAPGKDCPPEFQQDENARDLAWKAFINKKPTNLVVGQDINAIKDYLTLAVNNWREIKSNGKDSKMRRVAIYYIDAFQSVHYSIFGTLVPRKP